MWDEPVTENNDHQCMTYDPTQPSDPNPFPSSKEEVEQDLRNHRVRGHFVDHCPTENVVATCDHRRSRQVMTYYCKGKTAGDLHVVRKGLLRGPDHGHHHVSLPARRGRVLAELRQARRQVERAVTEVSRIAASSLWLLATACARHGADPTSAGQTHTIETEDFALPLPDGYADVSAALHEEASNPAVVLRASTSTRDDPPTIVVRKVPLPGGSFDDPTTCARTGEGLVTGGAEAPGTGGTLLSAAIIDGPVGKTCQIHLRAPRGMALITELHLPGNTPGTPKDLWLMTCNYAEGDGAAEATCRSALAGFRFRAR
jgi:hypothetical protein